jgi:hypothetical protein
VSDAPLAATRGWVPHRLLSSKVVWDGGRDAGRQCREIARYMYRPDVQEKRTALFLDMAFDTVREIEVTADFPALGLFWLHMAHAACLAAMLEAMQQLCPNVYTRPFDYLDDVQSCSGLELRARWISALNLDVDIESIVAALRRTHGAVAEKFPEPRWAGNVRSGTRYEYRYWLSRDELEWRIQVAREMARRGEIAGAAFYLRFCGYATARIPMVHARSGEGRDVSFLRPEQPVLPELRRLIPEIIDDLNLIFSGTHAPEQAAVQQGLSMLNLLRADAVALLRSRGSTVPELKPWVSVQPQHVST